MWETMQPATVLTAREFRISLCRFAEQLIRLAQ
jgi:hypothetical protein